MNFLEARETRRDIFILAAVLASELALGSACQTQEQPAFPEDKIIESDDIPQLEKFLKRKIQSFPIVQILSSSIDNIPDSIKKYGIEAFWVGRNKQNDNLAFSLFFVGGVEIGKSYAGQFTPHPSFIFIDEDSKIADVESNYLWTGQNDQVKTLLMEFNIPLTNLAGKKFAIHLNAKLITVNGQERPAFTIPYRFALEANNTL